MNIAEFYKKSQKLKFLKWTEIVNQISKMVNHSSLYFIEKDQESCYAYVVDDVGQRRQIVSDGGGSVVNLTSFTHEQIEEDETWEINHQLKKYPHPLFLDALGFKIEPDEIQYIDENNMIVKFIPATKGKAYLI